MLLNRVYDPPLELIVTGMGYWMPLVLMECVPLPVNVVVPMPVDTDMVDESTRLPATLRPELVVMDPPNPVKSRVLHTPRLVRPMISTPAVI